MSINLDCQLALAFSMLGIGWVPIVLAMTIAGLRARGLQAAVDEIFDESFGFTPSTPMRGGLTDRNGRTVPAT